MRNEEGEEKVIGAVLIYGRLTGRREEGIEGATGGGRVTQEKGEGRKDL